MNRTELVRDLLRSPYIKMLSESRSYSRSMIHRAIVSEVLRIEEEGGSGEEKITFVPDELSDSPEMKGALEKLINFKEKKLDVDEMATVVDYTAKLFLKAKKTATPEDDKLAMDFYTKLADMLDEEKLFDSKGEIQSEYWFSKFQPWFVRTREAYSKKIGQYYAQDASSFPELMKKDGKDFIKGLITFAQAQLGEEVYGKYQKTLINLLKKAIDAEAAKGEETIKEADGAEESQEDPSEAFANALQKLKVIDAEQAIMLAKKLKTLSDGPKKQITGFDQVLRFEDTKIFFRSLVKFFKEKGLNTPEIVDALTLFSEKVQDIPDEVKPDTSELDGDSLEPDSDTQGEESNSPEGEKTPANAPKPEEKEVQKEAILREQPETVAAIKTIVKGLRDGGVDLDVDQNTLLRKKLLAIANKKPKAPVAEFSREDVEAILQMKTGNEILNAIEKKVKDSLGGRLSPELRKLALSIKDKTPGAIRDFLSSEIFAMDVGDQSDIEDKLSKIYPPEKDYSDHPLFKGLDENERKIMVFVNEKVFKARKGQITKGNEVVGTFSGEDMKKRYKDSLGAVSYLQKEILPAIVITLGQEAVGSMLQEEELEEGFFDSAKNKDQTTSLVSLVQRIMGRDNSDYIRNYTNFKKAFSSKAFRQFYGKLKGLVNAFMNPNMKVTVIVNGEKEVLSPENTQDGPQDPNADGGPGGEGGPTITQGEQDPNAEGGTDGDGPEVDEATKKTMEEFNTLEVNQQDALKAYAKNFLNLQKQPESLQERNKLAIAKALKGKGLEQGQASKTIKAFTKLSDEEKSIVEDLMKNKMELVVNYLFGAFDYFKKEGLDATLEKFKISDKAMPATAELDDDEDGSEEGEQNKKYDTLSIKEILYRLDIRNIRKEVGIDKNGIQGLRFLAILIVNGKLFNKPEKAEKEDSNIQNENASRNLLTANLNKIGLQDIVSSAKTILINLDRDTDDNYKKLNLGYKVLKKMFLPKDKGGLETPIEKIKSFATKVSEKVDKLKQEGVLHKDSNNIVSIEKELKGYKLTKMEESLKPIIERMLREYNF
jgi:hypothetical protein